MAKKKAVVRKGIFLTRNSKGIVVSIHGSNGRKLAVMQGYNTKRNAEKGIYALGEALSGNSSIEWNPMKGKHELKFVVTDLTKPMKKTAKPKSK